MTEEPVDDAWKQVADLQEKYSQDYEVRPDLLVQALGVDRNVRLTLFGERDGEFGQRSFKETQRNVKTMRELAYALLDACAFVEQSNPTWAGLFPDGQLPHDRIKPVSDADR